MKKYCLIFSVILVTLFTVGCSKAVIDSNNSSTSNTAKQTSSAVASTTQTKTAESIAINVSKKVNGSTPIKMAAELIGATEGYSFTLNDNKYEIYKFTDTAKINEAKTGSFKINIEGIGEYTMKSVVNGDFVLIYTTVNENINKAFAAE